jgi:hypothetical protein
MDYNPYLKRAAPGTRGGVEKRENIEWQHRAEPPTQFENRLGDALEQVFAQGKVFAQGIEPLSEVVAELNKGASRDRAGNLWTEETFRAEMKRLGA